VALAHGIDPPSDSNAELGTLIRQARERAGIRQVDLAAAIHVGLSTVATWERGVHDVAADALPLIAAALGVRFVAEPGGWRVVSGEPAGPVVVVAGTAEAMNAALDRLGVPRAE
jgi:transcriptional regulator with XRE-family HTH domain